MLVGCQEEHPACKKWMMRCRRGYLSGARCKWFAYGPADAIAIPSSPHSLKSRMVSPFWCRLTQVVLEKRPLNGFLSAACGCRYKPTAAGHWGAEWRQLHICDVRLDAGWHCDACVPGVRLIRWCAVWDEAGHCSPDSQRRTYCRHRRRTTGR